MWLQMLYIVLPGLALALPTLGGIGLDSVKDAIDRRDEKKRSALGLPAKVEAPAASALSSGKSKPAAIEGSNSFESRRAASDAASNSGFSTAIATLEQRSLENENHKVYGYLFSLIEELRVLDAKLKLIGAEQQTRLTYSKYIPLISKITDLTASSNYGDFVRNPDHWEDPKRKRIQVEMSVVALAKEVSGDIRKLNSSQELDFQVTVESIIGKAASESGPQDEDQAMRDLLSEELGIGGGLGGDLESLQLAIASEAEALASKRAEDELDEERKAKAELEAKKFQAGSKAELEIHGIEGNAVRPTVISRELFKQTYTIFGPSSSSNDHMVLYSNSITGENTWKRFSAVYKAAEWMDTEIAKERKKHDHKCQCVYCRAD